MKPFGQKDNGGDLVETAFLIQGLLAVHQYYVNGNEKEKALAKRIDQIWRETGIGIGKEEKTFYIGIGVLLMAGKWIFLYMDIMNV